MKKITFLFLTLFVFYQSFSQNEVILAIQGQNIVLIDYQTGTIIDPLLGTLTPLNATTPKGIRQIDNEVWITDQVTDMIYRFDLTQNHLSNITGNLDNIKGLDIVDGSEVWVTNSGSSNSAPGDAIVRYDTAGNHLGHFMTGGRTPFDVVDDNNGNVYISYSNNGSPIEKRDYSGNLVQTLVPSGTLSFVQQLDIMASGNLLAGAFSSPAGIYVFDSTTGAQLNYWPQSGVRGVIETGDGSILWSSSTGIHRLDPTTGTSVTLLAGSAQYFTRIDLSDGCTDPTLTVTTPDDICEGDSTTINVTSNGDEVNWYATATSTTPIHTGTSFTTPNLSSTASYWVQATNFGSGPPQQYTGGGRVAPSSNSSGTVNPNTSPWGLTFDVDVDFTIISVDVHLTSSTPNDLVLQLLDDTWNVLQTTTVPCPAGPAVFQVPVGFDVTAGNTYHLVAASGPAMVREFSSGHPGFPYPIDTVGTVLGGTINNSNTNSGLYYFFYNWTVEVITDDDCTSDMEEVVVTVNPTPDAPTGDAIQDFVDGETLADLDVMATGTLIWYEDAAGTLELTDSTLLVDGTTYYVSQTIDSCESPLLAITVNEVLGLDNFRNSEISIYPNPANGHFFIQSKEPIGQVEIFDMTGRSMKVLDTIKEGKVDWSDLAAGTYFVQIRTGNAMNAIKVIKN